MSVLADIPHQALVLLGNTNRVEAMGVAFDGPANGLLLKYATHKRRRRVVMMAGPPAIEMAAALHNLARLRSWGTTLPTPDIPITATDRARAAAYAHGPATDGHIIDVRDGVVVVLGFGDSFGLCLRLGGDQAGWLAGRVHQASSWRLLRRPGMEVPASLSAH